MVQLLSVYRCIYIIPYNNAFRVLTGLPHHIGTSGMFVETRTDGFPAVMRKKILHHRLRDSRNSTLITLNLFDSSLLWHLIKKGNKCNLANII